MASNKSNELYKRWIFEAIDHLRNRKARPDTARICNYIVRHHNGTSSEIELTLADLVESEDIIRVAYKGSISYRNAHRPRKKEARINILNTKYANRIVKEAITSAVNYDPAVNESCVSIQEIEGYVTNHGEDDGYVVQKYLPFVLRQLVNDRVIYTTDDNLYFASTISPQDGSHVSMSGEAESDDDNWISNDVSVPKDNGDKIVPTTSPQKYKSKTSHATASSSKGHAFNVKNRRGRPAGRRKRFKKSHGPDFVEEDYGLSIDSQCDYCLSQRNKQGQQEGLIYCKDCNAKAHPSCMKYSDVLARRARNSPWQCIDCKTCYVCEDSGDPDLMLFCDACDKGYHMNCHNPPLSHKPIGTWACSKCVLEGTGELSDEMVTTNDVNYPTPCASPTSSADAVLISPPKLTHLDDSDIPDASDWAISQVVEFFTLRGFPVEANNLREQEIDGKSLLLLKRNDVLTGLSLKLGPALKIYAYIERLQQVGELNQ